MTAVFPMPSTTHPAMRRAALTLYAADSTDRAWLIEQMPRADRSMLEEMLAELAQLGMPRDAAMVRAVLQESTSATAAPLPAVPPQPRTLDRADARAIAALLDNEPASLAAHAVRMLPAHRRAAVVEALNPRVRRQVQEQLDGAAPEAAAALGRAVGRELVSRLPPLAPPLWRRMVQRIALRRRLG